MLIETAMRCAKNPFVCQKSWVSARRNVKGRQLSPCEMSLRKPWPRQGDLFSQQGTLTSQSYACFSFKHTLYFSSTLLWLGILHIWNKDIPGSYFYSAAWSWFISVWKHPRNKAALFNSSRGPSEVRFIAILAECFTTVSVFNISSVASFLEFSPQLPQVSLF